MMTTQRWLRCLTGIMCVVLPACTPTPRFDANHPIGTLGVAGSNVTLNASPATSGAPVYVGDRVATGPASSAIIDFTDGGSFQLDQNTDPLFVIERLQSGICILAHLLVGQVFVGKRQFCLETPDIQAINNSEINVQVSAGRTLLTVVRGKVTLQRPSGAPITTAQQLMASQQQQQATVRNVSSDELAALLRWRGGYRFQGWCCRGGKVSQSGRNDCAAQGFSFNRQLLEKSCAVNSPTVDFGEIFRRQRPTHRPRGDYPTSDPASPSRAE